MVAGGDKVDEGAAIVAAAVDVGVADEGAAIDGIALAAQATGWLVVFVCSLNFFQFLVFADVDIALMSLHLQKHKRAMAAPRKMPVSTERLQLVMENLASYASNQKFKKQYEAMTHKTTKKKTKNATKTPTAKSAASAADTAKAAPKPTKKRSTVFAGKKPNYESLSDSASGESEEEEKESEESEESEDEDFNYTMTDVSVGSTLVWGAHGGEGKLCLCVGLVTKKYTKKKKKSVTVTYLLPVKPCSPEGDWLGEKLSCNKYYTKEILSYEIMGNVFYIVKWEEENLVDWEFTLGKSNWQEILRRVKVLWPKIPASGVAFESQNK